MKICRRPSKPAAKRYDAGTTLRFYCKQSLIRPPLFLFQDADQLVLRRLQLAASRSIAHVDVAETVRATAQRIAGWHGEAALLDVLRALDPSFPDQLRAVLQGGEEKDMLAALEAMHLQRTPEDEAVTVLPTPR